MDSILLSIKKLLGIAEDYKHFDNDLVIHINSVLSVLFQLGIETKETFKITGENEKWNDFILDNTKIEIIKSYVFLKVKLLFDPPASSAIMESYKNLIQEFEWRINIVADSGFNK